MSDKLILRNRFLNVLMLLILGGCLDIYSSWVGLSLGLSEMNPLFLLIPAMSPILLIACAWLIYSFKWASEKVRLLLLAWLVMFSFVPFIWNLYHIMVVVL